MSLKILDQLYNKIDKLNGFGPKNIILFEKLSGSRFLDLIFHLPSSVIKRIKINFLEDIYLYKNIIVTGKIKRVWFSYKRPKISIITLEVGDNLLEIIYFNVNKKWFLSNFVVGIEIILSGELIKKVISGR